MSTLIATQRRRQELAHPPPWRNRAVSCRVRAQPVQLVGRCRQRMTTTDFIAHYDRTSADHQAAFSVTHTNALTGGLDVLILAA
jgi:hypothetical protein